MADLGPAAFVGEASTPWGRIRVSVWSRRPLGRRERAQLCEHLATCTTRLAAAGVSEVQALDALRRCVLGPHAVVSEAEVLR